VEITAKKFTGINDIPLTNITRTPLGRGLETKNVVQATVTHNQRSRDVSLVERVNNTHFWLHNWQLLKDAGLPVPATVRLSEKNTILITNFKAHGEEMYGKGLLYEYEKIPPQELKLSHTDHIFLELMKTSKKAILTEMERLVGIANEHTVFLPGDDPFELLISPDGSWKFVITDLSWGGVGLRLEVSKRNQSVSDYFFNNLLMIEELLKVHLPIPNRAEKLKNRIFQVFARK